MFSGPVPEENESITVGGVSFTRENDSVFARYDGTDIRLAEFIRSGRDQ